jgi:hypothetical protein
MISSPRIGQRVQLWCAKKRASWFPHHGKYATVVQVGRGGGPKNHVIRLEQDGGLVCVPCGNLR